MAYVINLTIDWVKQERRRGWGIRWLSYRGQMPFYRKLTSDLQLWGTEKWCLVFYVRVDSASKRTDHQTFINIFLKFDTVRLVFHDWLKSKEALGSPAGHCSQENAHQVPNQSGIQLGNFRSISWVSINLVWLLHSGLGTVTITFSTLSSIFLEISSIFWRQTWCDLNQTNS